MTVSPQRACVNVCHHGVRMCTGVARTRWGWALVAACAAFSLAFAAPRSARACGACVCYDDQPWASWLSGGDPLPRNPRLLVTNSTVLVAADGTLVDIDVEPAGVDGASWIKPRALLRAHGEYGLAMLADDGDGGMEPGAILYRLVVGDAIDTTPLKVAGVRVDALAGSPSCNLTVGAELRTASIDDADNPGGLVYAQIQVSVAEHIDTAIVPLQAFVQAQAAEFGRADAMSPGACLLSRTIVDAQAGAKAEAAVTFFDLAGNATPLDPLPFEFAAIAGAGGCPAPPLPRATDPVTNVGPEPRSISTQDAGANTTVDKAASRPYLSDRSGAGCTVRSAGQGGAGAHALAWCSGASLALLVARRRRG